MSKTQTPTDPGKELVQTGKNQRLNAYVIPNFQYSTLGRLILYRIINNRDVKMVITSKGSTTGTGKTTLACILANTINKYANDYFNRSDNWSAKEQSFMDVWEYLRKYKDAKPGEPLITDELEYLADKRRSMSNQNVKFSQAWQILRYKNVITIGTAPSLWDMDKRVLEHTDIWINVLYKGRANTYYLTVDDFTGLPVEKRLKQYGYRESLLWEDISDHPNLAEDLKYLNETKEDLGIPGIDDQQNITEKDVRNKERSVKQQIAINMLEEKEKGRLTLTQTEIGEIVGYSQQNIWKLKKEHIDD